MLSIKEIKTHSTSVICLASIFAFSVACFLFVINNSWFLGQDFDHLVLLQNLSFAEYLITPIDIHAPLPLHRLATWFVFEVAGMRYDVAVAFLVLAHLAGCIYLYKLLQLIKPGVLAIVVVTIYSVNFYIVDLLMWWSAGLHRFPYVLCTLGACYHAIKLCDGKYYTHAFLALSYFIVALGFFEKGIFIPLYVAWVISCRYVLTKEVPTFKQLTMVAIMLVGSAFYLLALWHPEQHRPSIHDSLHAAYVYVSAALQIFMPFEHSRSLNVTALIAFLLLSTFLVFRNRLHFFTVLGLIIVVFVNVWPLASSSRVAMFGMDVVRLNRYYFDMVFLFSIFLYCFLVEVKFDGLKNNNFLSLRVWPVLFGVAIVLYGFFSFENSTNSSSEFYSSHNGGPAAAEFVDRFSADLFDLKKEGEVLVFADRIAPTALYTSFFGAPDLNLSQIFKWFDDGMMFVAGDGADYIVLDSGEIKAIAK